MRAGRMFACIQQGLIVVAWLVRSAGSGWSVVALGLGQLLEPLKGLNVIGPQVTDMLGRILVVHVSAMACQVRKTCRKRRTWYDSTRVRLLGSGAMLGCSAFAEFRHFR